VAEIAIIGSGIAGLGCAWWLTECGHNVTVYAGGPRVGGHSHTVLANTRQGKQVPVDTGFIVYNERTYPNLIKLFAQLEVPTIKSDMSFSVSLYGGEIEYSGASLRSMFAQPSLLLSPAHWRMIRDILRFYKEAPQLLNQPGNPSLLEYLQAGRYSDEFVSRHLVPMASAIWSTPPADMMQFPAKSLIRFFVNHGLLQVKDRPQWYTVSGGSVEYIKRITAKFADNIVGAPATRVKRTNAGPLVECNGSMKAFDAVVLACHADEALALVMDPTEAEQELLGAFRFSKNLAVLHQDDKLMPKRDAAWASWSYLTHPDGKAALSYWMNNLQDIDDETQLFVTLNPPMMPDPNLTLACIEYMHPVFDAAAVAAQNYLGHLQGVGGLWYCGAWTGYGFHEDGLTSGLTVAEYISGIARPWSVTEMSNAAANVQPINTQAEAA
jgi:uncharacterized protein